MEFQNIEDERGMDPFQCVAWSSLYRAKYVTRSELVEGKFSKEGKFFDKVSGFISGILIFSQKKKIRDLMVLSQLLVTVVSCQMMPSE